MRTTERAANFSKRFPPEPWCLSVLLLWPVRWVWLALRTFYQTDDESPVTFMYPPYPPTLLSHCGSQKLTLHARSSRARVSQIEPHRLLPLLHFFPAGALLLDGDLPSQLHRRRRRWRLPSSSTVVPSSPSSLHHTTHTRQTCTTRNTRHTRHSHTTLMWHVCRWV